MKSYLLGQAWKFGWETTKQRFWFFFRISLIVLLLVIITQTLGALTEKDGILEKYSLLVLCFSLILSFVQGTASLGFMKIALKIGDNQPVSLGDLFPWKFLWPAVLSKFIIQLVLFIPLGVLGIIVAIGLIALGAVGAGGLEALTGVGLIAIPVSLIIAVVYASYLSLRFMLTDYFIVDQGLSATKALKASSAATKGLRWSLLWTSFVLGCINILGLLLLGIGLFWTVPATILTMAHVYRQIVSQNISTPAATITA